MFNPFQEQSSEHSQEPPSLPVSIQTDPHTASPISFLHLQHLSEQLADPDFDARTEKKLNHLLKEVKSYSQSLQKRNLQMACELQRERNKNKQLMSALTFLTTAEDERNRSLEQKLGQMTQNGSKLEIQQNRREMIESEVKALRLENGYLKDLILIANDNYQKLEEKNRLFLDKYANLEQQHHQREVEMFKRTEELKSIFAVMVLERNQGRQQSKHRMDGIGNQTAPGCSKGGKKEHAQDAYRSIFMKTLKPRKQNIHKQI